MEVFELLPGLQAVGRGLRTPFARSPSFSRLKLYRICIQHPRDSLQQETSSRQTSSYRLSSSNVSGKHWGTKPCGRNVLSRPRGGSWRISASSDEAGAVGDEKPEPAVEAVVAEGEEAVEEAATGNVTVKVSITQELAFGEGLVIIGAPERLGAWDPSAAPALTWTEGHVWVGELELEPNQSIEYKLLIVKGDSREVVAWQPGPNHLLITGPGPVVDLITTWDAPQEPATATEEAEPSPEPEPEAPTSPREEEGATSDSGVAEAEPVVAEASPVAADAPPEAAAAAAATAPSVVAGEEQPEGSATGSTASSPLPSPGGAPAALEAAVAEAKAGAAASARQAVSEAKQAPGGVVGGGASKAGSLEGTWWANLLRSLGREPLMDDESF